MSDEGSLDDDFAWAMPVSETDTELYRVRDLSQEDDDPEQSGPQELGMNVCCHDLRDSIYYVPDPAETEETEPESADYDD
jgi:hypothetical protein